MTRKHDTLDVSSDLDILSVLLVSQKVEPGGPWRPAGSIPISGGRDRAPLAIEVDRDVGPRQVRLGPDGRLSPHSPAGSGRTSTSEAHMTNSPARRLRKLHRLLEQRLREERTKPRPNALTVQALSRRQLEVKNAMARVEAHA